MPCSGRHTPVRWVWAGHIMQNVAQAPHHQALTNQASLCLLFTQMGQVNTALDQWPSISGVSLYRIQYKYSSSPLFSIKRTPKTILYLSSTPLKVLTVWNDKLKEGKVSIQCHKSKLRMVKEIWDFLILCFVGNMNKYFPFMLLSVKSSFYPICV